LIITLTGTSQFGDTNKDKRGAVINCTVALRVVLKQWEKRSANGEQGAHDSTRMNVLKRLLGSRLNEEKAKRFMTRSTNDGG
jgi:hypothetical protein